MFNFVSCCIMAGLGEILFPQEADEPAAWRNVSGPGANPGASQGPPANASCSIFTYFYNCDGWAFASQLC